MIVPLFKKGDRNDVKNYHAITILSCFGKHFTAVINCRLTKYVESLGIIGPEQAGFRNGYSTMDHVFTFKMLLDLYQGKKKQNVAFIDYRNLWLLLLEVNYLTKILMVNFLQLSIVCIIKQNLVLS